MIAAALILPGITAAAQGKTTDSKSGSAAQERSGDTGKTGTRRNTPDKAGEKSKETAIVYRKVETTNYIIEVPEKWEVSQETPFGQREIHPAKEAAKEKAADSTKEVAKSGDIGESRGDKSASSRPETEKGPSMSSMTGPGLGKQSWDQLYKTSLFYITRSGREGGSKMKPTAYTLGKSKQGFETCSWTMNDTDSHPLARHVILKHTNANILALSVKLPPAATRETKERLERIFQHMVNTAVVR